MRIEGAPRRRRPIVGLTPLIDVVFILLIFFMLASSFLDWRSISLAIPPLTTDPVDTDTVSLVVELGTDGRQSIDGRSISAAELGTILSAAVEEDARRSVVIRPEGGVPLDRVMAIVDLATASGVTALTLDRGAD